MNKRQSSHVSPSEQYGLPYCGTRHPPQACLSFLPAGSTSVPQRRSAAVGSSAPPFTRIPQGKAHTLRLARLPNRGSPFQLQLAVIRCEGHLCEPGLCVVEVAGLHFKYPYRTLVPVTEEKGPYSSFIAG
jgi:hypothetical protein